MQYGEDYGFNRLDAYPITDWLNDSRHKGGMLKVRLSVDEHVFWDVDEIRIEFNRSQKVTVERIFSYSHWCIYWHNY